VLSGRPFRSRSEYPGDAHHRDQISDREDGSYRRWDPDHVGQREEHVIQPSQVVFGAAVLSQVADRRLIARAVCDMERMIANGHSSIQEDHQEVEPEAERDQRKPGQANVQEDERQQNHVGGDQEPDRQPAAEAGTSGDRDELEDEAQERQRPPAEVGSGKRVEASAQREADKDPDQ